MNIAFNRLWGQLDAMQKMKVLTANGNEADKIELMKKILGKDRLNYGI